MSRKGFLCGILLLFLLQIRGSGSANPGKLQSNVWESFGSNRHFIVVAHQDDDLLFMNPDLWNFIKEGHWIETVYTTAGDRRRPDKYWLGREAGVKAVYAYMAGLPDEWTEEKLNLADHQIIRFTLVQNPKIRLVFLRLPDGLDIQKWEVTLKTIWQYDQVIIYSKDHQNYYRKGTLIRVLQALQDEYRPDTISYLYPGDHVDHYYTAKFMELADANNRKEHIVMRYRDYNINKSPQNLDAFDTHLKWKIVQVYGRYDQFFPKWGLERTYNKYYNWCHRQYYFEGQDDGQWRRKNPLDDWLTQ